jgi:hypothetical protein
MDKMFLKFIIWNQPKFSGGCLIVFALCKFQVKNEILLWFL